MNMMSKWKCLYTNANSIVGKVDELRQRISNSNYDIIAITESWAKNDVGDAELKIDGYLMYRKDKAADSRAKGGGVLLYVKEKLRSRAPSCTTWQMITFKTQFGVRLKPRVAQ